MDHYLIIMVSFKSLMALAWAGDVISVALLAVEGFGGAS